MVTCNNTLANETIENETPLWTGGLTFHHLGLLLSAVFGAVSIVISLYLIFQHATHYSKPSEQRHIIRIVLMIPVYSITSFLSYQFYTKAVYYEVLGNCYEAIAIAAFFTLLCHYVAPTLHEQKDYFRQLTPINWFWSVFGLQHCTGGQDKGILRRPRSGLTWFNVIWIGVFQYCFIRILFTIVAVITQATGRYCEDSLNPAFAHIWVLCFEGVSVSVAMFCLIQFYLQLRVDLAEYRPFLKVLSIKLVIFFSFWQSLLISFLTSSGAVKPTEKIQYPDISVGIPNLLLCIEMAIFSVMHLFAFPWRGYVLSKQADPLSASGSRYPGGSPPQYQGGRLGARAILDALNPWDIIKASARGARWLFVGRKKRFEDVSYKGFGSKTPPMPPPVDGDATPPTELRPGADNGRGRARPGGAPDSDTAGLLLHAAGTSPSRHDDGGLDLDGAGDLSTMPSHVSQPLPTAYGGYDDFRDGGLHPGYADTGYHGAQGMQPQQAGVAAGGHSGEWDHWAGAMRPSDEQSMRPPTYRTEDV